MSIKSVDDSVFGVFVDDVIVVAEFFGARTQSKEWGEELAAAPWKARRHDVAVAVEKMFMITLSSEAADAMVRVVALGDGWSNVLAGNTVWREIKRWKKILRFPRRRRREHILPLQHGVYVGIHTYPAPTWSPTERPT